MRGSIATVILAAALVLSMVPAVQGYHLSVGTEDSVGVAPSETPETPSVSDELYQRGTLRDCYEADGTLDDIDDAAAADGFCGRLVYNQGTSYEQLSPPDQDIRMDGWTFDVVFTQYVGNYHLSSCLPWCLPGGDHAYEILHGVGGQANPLPDDGADDRGWQTYAVNTHVPHASLTAQQATGAWDGDGWLLAAYDESMVAFLLDEDGQPVDDERLDTVIQAQQEAGRLQDAWGDVCGYTPDEDDGVWAIPNLVCEVNFQWLGEPWDASGEDAWNPWDACSSPAYVCGGLTPAWYAYRICRAAVDACAHDAHPVADGGYDSTDDFDVWHFVVAPTLSGCSGLQEPGFATSSEEGTWPYLAHDLDVYTPATSPVVQDGLEAPTAWGEAAEERLKDELPAVGASVVEADRVEPNAPGDTSQSTIEVERTEVQDCHELIDTSEDPSTLDPWVDIIDTQVTRDATGDLASKEILGVSLPGDGLDLYGSDGEHQDASNRPGPGQYFLEGKLGVFTDKDDDGAYERAPPSDLYSAIYQVGAYPMFWDMELEIDGDGDPQPDIDDACFGGCPQTLSGPMTRAGYGIHTGLIQVLYLEEPTYLYHWRSEDVVPYTQGETAFVFMSQSMHLLHDLGDQRVHEAVDDALSALPVEPSQVVFPAEAVDATSDFYGQLEEGTNGYTSSWGFLHHCQAGCQGDTVVTSYLFEVTSEDGVLGGDDGSFAIPAFRPEGHRDGYSFGQGNHTWIDIDPLDGDPSRNHEESSAPPN